LRAGALLCRFSCGGRALLAGVCAPETAKLTTKGAVSRILHGKPERRKIVSQMFLNIGSKVLLIMLPLKSLGFRLRKTLRVNDTSDYLPAFSNL
jgi:hypothetical protein